MGCYKIKDLEQLTGIKAHTIRMWEKRFQLFNPQRTDTKIRLYNDDELRLILNISLLNDNGMKISKIAELTVSEIQKKVDESSENLDDFGKKLLLSLLNLDEVLFLTTFNSLIKSYDLELTFANYIFPFLNKIGKMWQIGTIHPAQEHFISNLIRQKLITSIDLLPFVNISKKVVLFLPEHENHEFSLLFYNYLLKKNGFQTYYLGANLPFDALDKAIEMIQPDFLVCSWVLSIECNSIINYFKDIRMKTKKPIFSGGFQIVNNKAIFSEYTNVIEDSSFIHKMV